MPRGHRGSSRGPGRHSGAHYDAGGDHTLKSILEAFTVCMMERMKELFILSSSEKDGESHQTIWTALPTSTHSSNSHEALSQVDSVPMVEKMNSVMAVSGAYSAALHCSAQAQPRAEISWNRRRPG